jgi:hypothetical protein
MMMRCLHWECRCDSDTLAPNTLVGGRFLCESQKWFVVAQSAVYLLWHIVCLTDDALVDSKIVCDGCLNVSGISVAMALGSHINTAVQRLEAFQVFTHCLQALLHTVALVLVLQTRCRRRWFAISTVLVVASAAVGSMLVAFVAVPIYTNAAFWQALQNQTTGAGASNNTMCVNE